MHVDAHIWIAAGGVKGGQFKVWHFPPPVSVAPKSTACHATQSLMAFRQLSVERL